MKQIKKLYFAVAFALLLISLFLASKTPSLAQTPNYDVTVSPVFFDLSTNPGGTINERVRIRNNTTSPLSIKVEVKKLTGDQNGQLTLSEENSDNSLSWIKFNDETIVAKPLEWTNVPFKIEVPSDAAYGYYYAINFTQADTNSNDKTGASITGAAAVPILLNVKKDGAKAEVKLLDFSTGSFINEYLPIDFNIKLENTGNVHVRPRGNIFISRNGKDNIATIDVNQGSSSIIPATKKDFNASWSDGFIVREVVTQDGQTKLDKNGNEIKKLTINWNKLTDLRIGKYTANLLLVYDNGQRDIPIEASKTFWVIPYKVIIGTVIVIILIILLIRFIIRRYINREVRRRSGK